MKKLISLVFVSIYLTACSTPVSNDEIAVLNQQIGRLESEIDELEEINNQGVSDIISLEAELSTLEDINVELNENNSLLEEELALAIEVDLVEDEPDEGLDIDVKSYSQTGILTGPYNGQSVLEAGQDILWALHTDDLAIVASYIDPMNPVYLSPSQSFVRNNLVRLTASDIMGMNTDTTIYNWGVEQVTNIPISMTIADYFDTYVYDEFYIQSSVIGQNIVVSNSSVANVIADNFFYSIYNVEYMLPDFYTSNGAWRSITLSFIVEGPSPVLIAITHGY